MHDIIGIFHLDTSKKDVWFLDISCNVLTSAVATLKHGYKWFGCEPNMDLPLHGINNIGTFSSFKLSLDLNYRDLHQISL